MLKKFFGLIYKLYANYIYNKLTEEILNDNNPIVMGGPFAGMVYSVRALDMASLWTVGSATIPKLLGCYEAELQGVLSSVFSKRYDTIVNIGCGEGYYAIGCALRMPSVCVHAFDANPFMCHLCEDVARANGVAGRVSVYGECDIERLCTLTHDRTLVICDCEGCEMNLLRPDIVPGLVSCDLLVELHDFLDPNITEAILLRFSDTHDIELVSSVQRDPTTFSVLDGLTAIDQRIAVDEFRPGLMQWANMVAK